MINAYHEEKYTLDSQKYSNILDPLDEFNDQLLANEMGISLLEINTEKEYKEKIIKTPQIYVFVPNAPAQIEGEVAKIPTLISVLKSDYTWKNQTCDITISKDTFYNLGLLKNPSETKRYWTGMKLYTGQKFHQYIEENLKSDRGFARNYEIIKNKLLKNL